MRKALLWGGLLLILLVANGVIFQKEQTVQLGRTLYLELAPRDPRSLMQGDFMRLNYQVTRDARWKNYPESGSLVLNLDSRGVGTLVGVYTGKSLTANQCRIQYQRVPGRRSFFWNGSAQVSIGAESFFFQEGQGQLYAGARYGLLKVEPDGSSVLVALCDKDLNPIRP